MVAGAGAGFEPASIGYEPIKETTPPSRDIYIYSGHFRSRVTDLTLGSTIVSFHNVSICNWRPIRELNSGLRCDRPLY